MKMKKCISVELLYKALGELDVETFGDIHSDVVDGKVVFSKEEIVLLCALFIQNTILYQ
jgi:hypothetical protein